ncbi:TfuA-like protein [Streptomyces sp. NPDC002886]|uniref:TfuA-like protein n=1 Tax=Streptomyces sp. NPDC002886 TaxID=3364667 RepID=UPI003689E4E9
MTPRRIAFVGPTLPPSVRPDNGFAYLPPVRHGDLFALDLRAGDEVLIVDGVYQHFAPIRHKEILAQLARGVRVTGAASLGALRAAELADFGMRGLGHVYAAARAGHLVADADVGVLHAGEEDGGRRLTVAMVSVRTAVSELLAAGAIGAEEGALIERVAGRLHFTERSERALEHHAEGFRDEMRSVLRHIDRHGDVKTRDALAALDVLAAERGSGAAHAADPTLAGAVWQSSYGAEWEFDHRPLRPGSPIGSRLALACLQLFAADFPDRHRAYALRVAAESTGRHGGSAPALLGEAGFAPATRAAARLARPTAATVAWSPEERLLARTFRLRPGRLTYAGLPAEALAGGSLAELEQWCERLLAPAGTPPVPAGRCHELLRGLWQAHRPEEYRLCVLERGFRDEAEAARFAGAFDLALVGRLADAAVAS